jgi:hypothetical protein
MLKERQTVAIPVQEHGQIVIDICLREFVRKLFQMQYRLRNLQAIGVDGTVRILSKRSFLVKSEMRSPYPGTVSIALCK